MQSIKAFIHDHPHIDVYKRQDQVRKGAATNAVQIAQLLVE